MFGTGPILISNFAFIFTILGTLTSVEYMSIVFAINQFDQDTFLSGGELLHIYLFQNNIWQLELFFISICY